MVFVREDGLRMVLELRRWTAVCIAGVSLLALLVGVPQSVVAVSYGNYGTKVLAASPDFNPTYATLAAPMICSRDLGPPGVSIEDAYYLNMDGAGTVVAAFDLRLTASGSLPAGTLVLSGDADVSLTFNGLACTAFAANVQYLEGDGLPGFTAGDLVYWSADATVGVGDVRLAVASGAAGQDTQTVTVGTVVIAGTDADVVSITNTTMASTRTAPLVPPRERRVVPRRFSKAPDPSRSSGSTPTLMASSTRATASSSRFPAARRRRPPPTTSTMCTCSLGGPVLRTGAG